MALMSLHPEEEAEIAGFALKQVRKIGSTRFESRLTRIDGRQVNVEISSRIVNKERGDIQGIIRDITERKQVENALKESEEKYR